MRVITKKAKVKNNKKQKALDSFIPELVRDLYGRYKLLGSVSRYAIRNTPPTPPQLWRSYLSLYL